jgi:hypothetical protein
MIRPVLRTHRPSLATLSDDLPKLSTVTILSNAWCRETSYAGPYASDFTTPKLCLGGGGYAMQNQNLYAATAALTYVNGTTSYPDTQASGGMYPTIPT